MMVRYEATLARLEECRDTAAREKDLEAREIKVREDRIALLEERVSFMQTQIDTEKERANFYQSAYEITRKMAEHCGVGGRIAHIFTIGKKGCW